MGKTDGLRKALDGLSSAIEAYLGAFRGDAAALRALDELRRLAKEARNELADIELEALPAGTKDADSLTPRELEILSLIAAGLGNKEIAYRLSISDRTVQFHVRSIFEKTGARSRTEAAILGLRKGLIRQRGS